MKFGPPQARYILRFFKGGASANGDYSELTHIAYTIIPHPIPSSENKLFFLKLNGYRIHWVHVYFCQEHQNYQFCTLLFMIVE